jgi:hypothetical protein
MSFQVHFVLSLKLKGKWSFSKEIASTTLDWYQRSLAQTHVLNCYIFVVKDIQIYYISGA